MSMWLWLLAGALSAFAIKQAGYLLPERWLDQPAVPDLAAALTVGLLASLTITNTVATGQGLALDSRLLALGAAALALRFKAPFLLVVVIGAAAAALGRLCGLP